MGRLLGLILAHVLLGLGGQVYGQGGFDPTLDLVRLHVRDSQGEAILHATALLEFEGGERLEFTVPPSGDIKVDVPDGNVRIRMEAKGYRAVDRVVRRTNHSILEYFILPHRSDRVYGRGDYMLVVPEDIAHWVVWYRPGVTPLERAAVRTRIGHLTGQKGKMPTLGVTRRNTEIDIFHLESKGSPKRLRAAVLAMREDPRVFHVGEVSSLRSGLAFYCDKIVVEFAHGVDDSAAMEFFAAHRLTGAQRFGNERRYLVKSMDAFGLELFRLAEVLMRDRRVERAWPDRHVEMSHFGRIGAGE